MAFYNKPHYLILDEDQLSVNSDPKCTNILKIHGDLNHPRRLVITEKDYDIFLDKNPLLCTYISNLLISRTPLFIGYSLEDPDFRQIWQIIGSRLGNLRRNAYTFMMNASSSKIARFERRGVKVISLPGESYNELFSNLFKDIRSYLLEKLPQESKAISEESQIALALPRDARSRLCFFSISYQILPLYQRRVFPLFEQYHLVPIIAEDVISPGENIFAKVASLIDRSELVVVDVNSTDGTYELDAALNLKNANQVILVVEEDFEIPERLCHLKYVERSTDIESDEVDTFLTNLESILKEITKDIVPKISEEPQRLLDKEEYRAAVISAISLMEIELREKLYEHEDLRNDVYTFTLGKLLRLSLDYKYITDEEAGKATRAIRVRNRLVHNKEYRGFRKTQINS